MNDFQKQTIESYNKSADTFSSSIAKLQNYNHTYDYISDFLKDGDSLLDLACGPAQISKYLSSKKNIKIVGVDLSKGMLNIAKKELPDAIFFNESIIDFKRSNGFKAITIGFGLPYLSHEEIDICIKNSYDNLKKDGIIYLSFMEGKGAKNEKTSFGGINDFYIYYYSMEEIIEILESYKLKVIKTYKLDYKEMDGSMSTDNIIIAKK